MKPKDNEANMSNANLGTNGTNRQYDQVHGNRSKQYKELSDEEWFERDKKQLEEKIKKQTRLGLNTSEGILKAAGFVRINTK